MPNINVTSKELLLLIDYHRREYIHDYENGKYIEAAKHRARTEELMQLITTKVPA
jgi:hypothetical protein